MEFIARRYDTRSLVRLRLVGDSIESCEGVQNEQAGQTESRDDENVPWVAPGFCDIQVNGHEGQEFSSLELTAEKVEHIVRRQLKFGTVRVCPTLTTQSIECLSHGLRAIARATETSNDVARLVAGIHLEGPFIAGVDGPRGAHPAEHCQEPNWDSFQQLQEAAAGQLVLLTMSPEFESAPRFIAKVVASGVRVAIGHTAATGEQIDEAVDAGATLSTHLGNGAHRELRRHPNYIWDQLAEDRLMASLIVDGHHLPAEVVKTFVRAKSPERCILISDLSGLAGLPAGRYDSSGGELEILSDGRLVIAGQEQLLAGASRPIGTGVVNVMKMADVDLRTAVDMATLHPTRLLGQPERALRPGDPADLVLFQTRHGADGLIADLEVRATIVAGRVMYGDADGC